MTTLRCFADMGRKRLNPLLNWWRITDLDQLAAVQGHPRTKRQPDDQPTLLDEIPEVSI